MKIKTNHEISSRLSRILEVLAKAQKTKSTKEVLSGSFRAHLFALEGILRLHLRSEAYGKNVDKALNHALLRIKAVEDELGALGLNLERVAFAKEYKLNLKKFNGKKVSDVTQKRTLGNLSRWSKLFIELQSVLSSVKWKKDVKFLSRSLKKETHRIKDKIKFELSPLMNKKVYGDHELEEGLHEWRRMMRWISIYIQAYKPCFYLTESKAKKKRDLDIIKKYKHNPFCVLGTESNESIALDSLAYYWLSYFIEVSGEIKTQGEMELYFSHLGAKFKHYPVEKNSQSLLKEYFKINPLKTLKETL